VILDCDECSGTGEVREPCPVDGDLGDLVICDSCGGTGKASGRAVRSGEVCARCGTARAMPDGHGSIKWAVSMGSDSTCDHTLDLRPERAVIMSAALADCEFDHPHPGQPCALRNEEPGTPCRFCGDPVPMDGSSCPKCWQPITTEMFRSWAASNGWDTVVQTEPPT
jgi:hypothetical protein